MTQQDIEQYLSAGVIPDIRANIAQWNITTDQVEETCHLLSQEHHLPLMTLFASDERAEARGFRVYYVFGVPEKNIFLMPVLTVDDSGHFPSVVNILHEASLYERHIHTFFGLVPVGHPHLEPLILHNNWPAGVFPLRKDFVWNERPELADTPYHYQKVEGEGIYEIPVGPIHAGIIEPGYFRFSVAGEEIVYLEPRLGYVHKGSEKLFEQLSLPEAVKLSERISGDTSFTHALAFCQAIESLTGTEVSYYAKYVRVILSELERLANHFNDIGFVMTDTSYTFGGSHGTRLREQIMQWNERLTGNRFLRGAATPGGVNLSVSTEIWKELAKDCDVIEKDFMEVLEVAMSSLSMINRLKETGILSKEVAEDHGAVGYAARCLDIARDARKEFPYAAYSELPVSVITEKGGDVYARWRVRIREVFESLKFIRQSLSQLESVGDQPLRVDIGPLAPSACGIGVTEGWRGEIVYAVLTDANGKITRVRPRDPSFLNWSVVPYAVAGNMVPDFPLINKSFNLSYSGNDL